MISSAGYLPGLGCLSHRGCTLWGPESGLSWLTSIDSRLELADRRAQTQMMARMKARTKEIADLS
eukprot:scaffold62335_cov38-Phaeocystis_antarctica.AAC.1